VCLHKKARKTLKKKKKTNDGLTEKSKLVPCQALCGVSTEARRPFRNIHLFIPTTHTNTHTLQTQTLLQMEHSVQISLLSETVSIYLKNAKGWKVWS